MSTSKFLHLFVDSKAVDPFEIQATANDAIFSYANKPLKMNGDLQYKSGVAYVSLVSKLGLVDASIASEAMNARAAELVLRNDLTTEQNRAIESEQNLYTALQAEITTRVNADGLFQIALANEIATRSTADTKQASDLSFEASRASSAEGVLLGLINTESTTARSAELVLRNDLATEVSDRKSAVSSEVATRLSADNALGVRVDNEITRATGAEVSNFQTLDGYIATEQARAMTKENSLQNQVNFIIGNVDAKAMDSLSEIVSKLNSAGSDLYARVLYLEQVVSTLRGEALYAAAQSTYTPGVAPAVP
jgi:uncharacterized protein YueI